MSMQDERRYLTDDRDINDDELVVSMGGNGDWYVSIVKHGQKIGPTVRVTTSGSPRGLERVCIAIADLWQAMGDGHVACKFCLMPMVEGQCYFMCDCVKESKR